MRYTQMLSGRMRVFLKESGTITFLLTAIVIWSSAGNAQVAQLPLNWVNQHECDGTATVVKRVCHQGDSQCPNGPGDYDTTLAGLKQALTNAENLRVTSDIGTLLQITVGAQFHVTGIKETITLPNLGYTGSDCIIIDSSNPLPSGVRVGSIAMSSISRQGNTVTVVTQTPHGLTTGQTAEIKNVTGWTVNFNGVYAVTVIDGSTFSYAQAGPNESGIVTPFFTVVTGPNTLAQQAAANMYTMASSMVVAPIIATDAGAHHYAIYDGEMAAAAEPRGLSGPLVLLGPLVSAETYAGNASNLGVDRMYFHGCAGTVSTTIPIWPEPIPCGAQDLGLKMGVRMECAYCWVMNSFFDQMQLPGLESHVVGTFNGQGPFKVVNNHLRGGATGLHFGARPRIPGLIPSDIEVRLNTLDLDPNWQPLSHFCGGGPAKWGIKERLDFENLRRMVFEGNELFQAWCDGDQGALVLMGPSACPPTPNCTSGNQNLLSDIYFANNLLAHGYHGLTITGRGGPNLGGLTMPAQRFDVINNLLWDLGVPGYGVGTVREISIGSANETFTCDASRSANVSTLTACVCTISNCPYTGVSTGDWVLVTNCTDASFNTSQNPALLSDPTTSGPITYSNLGPDTGNVSCTLGNGQGWPNLFNFQHNTFVANPVLPGVRFLGNRNPGLYARNFTLINSISSNSPSTSTRVGWACSDRGDGSRSTRSGGCFDVTTLNFNYFVAEGRSDSNEYSEYFNGTEIYPARTLFFPPTNSCNGTYTSGCLGYVGDFATANPSDYHDFALCQRPGVPSAKCTGRSAYAGTGSDGFDYGVDLSQLDLARVKSQFNSNSFPQ